jgi:hypothetical protein
MLKKNKNLIYHKISECRCEELREKLVMLELKYSELELKYDLKEQELRDLSCKFVKLTSDIDSQQPVPTENFCDMQINSTHIAATAKEAKQNLLGEEVPVPTMPKPNEQVDALVSSAMQDVTKILKRLRTVEESRSRLKEKTRTLLRQYRDKRALLERRERQLMSQRTGLQQLQLLLQSQNSSQLLVLRHTASHLQELARLLAALHPGGTGIQPPPLVQGNIFSKQTTYFLPVL